MKLFHSLAGATLALSAAFSPAATLLIDDFSSGEFPPGAYGRQTYGTMLGGYRVVRTEGTGAFNDDFRVDDGLLTYHHVSGGLYGRIFVEYGIVRGFNHPYESKPLNADLRAYNGIRIDIGPIGSEFTARIELGVLDGSSLQVYESSIDLPALTGAQSGTLTFDQLFQGNTPDLSSVDMISFDLTSRIRGEHDIIVDRIMLVPEPETYALMALGLGSVWLARRRKR